MNRLANRTRGLSRATKKGLRGWIFVAPFVVGFLLVYGKILLDSVLYSFYDVYVTDRLTMVYKGFQNYKDALLVDPDFNRTVVESLQNLFFELPVILIFSLFIAILLNQKMIGRGFFRSVFFIPVILTTGVIMKAEINNSLISSVMNSMMVDTGVTQSAGTAVLDALDMQKLLLSLNLNIDFTNYIINLVNSIYDIVTKAGVQILIFLAGLQSISPAIYESAQIEGASGWEQLWKITFPMISPIIFANLIYTILDSFTRSDNALMLLIQKTGFETSNYGLASAMAWLYSIVIVIVIAVLSLICSRFIFYQQRD